MHEDDWLHEPAKHMHMVTETQLSNNRPRFRFKERRFMEDKAFTLASLK